MSGIADEVKAKLDIVQIVSEYLPLRKAGIRFKAPCPFHHEKDPSFYVNPDWQIWHCFGCNEGGDVFDFVQRMDGLDFSDALKLLAKKAGVELKREDYADSGRRQRLMEANRWAAKFWHEVLSRSSQAEPARAYVKRRGLKEETVEDWLIGYAPDSWDATLIFLKKKGFTDEEIYAAGLVSRRERGDGYFDRFSNRLMFPISDSQGNIVGFTGRVMPDAKGVEPKDTGKYVNTAQTEIYNKSQILFAFDKAKRAIRREGFAVVVEGNMDAIASHEAGVQNVVASSGTAFTIDQLQRLRKLVDKLILSFDMDPAGEKAVRKSIDLAVAEGFEVRVLRLPPGAGKDPDEAIRKDPTIWQKAIAEAVPFMEWYLELAKSRTDFKDAYAKREAAQGILAEIAKLPTAVERSHWLKRTAELFGVPESDLQGDLLKARSQAVLRPGATNQPATAKGTPATAKTTDRVAIVSQYLLGLAFSWPELADQVVAETRPEWLTDDLQPLYKEFLVFYNENRTSDAAHEAGRYSAVRNGESKTAEKIAILELLTEKEFGDLPTAGRREELAKLIGELKRLHISRRQRELTAEMAQAEKAGDAARIQEIQRQINELIL